MDFPEPVISVAVEPKTKDDQEKMGIALGKLAQEDPSFRVKYDEEDHLIKEILLQAVGTGSAELAQVLAERAHAHWRNCTGLLRKHVTEPSPKLSVKRVAHFVVREGSAIRKQSFLNDVLAEGQASLLHVDGVHWTMLQEEHAAGLARTVSEFLSTC